MKKNAFTLIELILYIGIVTIVLSSIVPFAWNMVQTGQKNAVQQEIASQGRYVGERLKMEIRNALSINTGPSNFDVNLASNPSYLLSLSEAPPNDPTIISVTGGKIMIKQGASPAVALHSARTTATDLVFTNYSSSDNKSKHVGFVFTLTSDGTGQEYQGSITVRGSAELRRN